MSPTCRVYHRGRPSPDGSRLLTCAATRPDTHRSSCSRHRCATGSRGRSPSPRRAGAGVAGHRRRRARAGLGAHRPLCGAHQARRAPVGDPGEAGGGCRAGRAAHGSLGHPEPAGGGGAVPGGSTSVVPDRGYRRAEGARPADPGAGGVDSRSRSRSPGARSVDWQGGHPAPICSVVRRVCGHARPTSCTTCCGSSATSRWTRRRHGSPRRRPESTMPGPRHAPQSGWRDWRASAGRSRCRSPARNAGSRLKTPDCTATPQGQACRRRRACFLSSCLTCRMLSSGWLAAGVARMGRSRASHCATATASISRRSCSPREQAGELVRGELHPGGTRREWCDPDVLRRLRRASLAALRREIEPADRGRCACFAVSWHGIDRPVPPAAGGVDRLRETLVPLQGLPLTPRVWEHDVLPARLQGYSPAWLDALCALGELVWTGAGAVGRGEGRVAFYFRDDGRLLGPPPPDRRWPTPASGRVMSQGLWRSIDERPSRGRFARRRRGASPQMQGHWSLCESLFAAVGAEGGAAPAPLHQEPA